MALDRITEFVNHLAEQPNSAEGFSAKVFYETGMTFGLTCREICDNFLGKDRALSRGKYPATVPDTLTASRKPAVPKAAKKVAAKKAKVAKVTKPSKKAKKDLAEEGLMDTPDTPDPDFTDDSAVFVYIATPEEIAAD